MPHGITHERNRPVSARTFFRDFEMRKDRLEATLLLKPILLFAFCSLVSGSSRVRQQLAQRGAIICIAARWVLLFCAYKKHIVFSNNQKLYILLPNIVLRFSPGIVGRGISS